MQIKIVKQLTVYGEFGYFFPEADMEKDPTVSCAGESLTDYWHGYINEMGIEEGTKQRLKTNYNSFEYKINDAYGGAVGLRFIQPIFKGLDLSVNAGYRFLTFETELWLYPNGGREAMKNPVDYLFTYDKQSFSGAQFGIQLSYNF